MPIVALIGDNCAGVESVAAEADHVQISNPQLIGHRRVGPNVADTIEYRHIVIKGRGATDQQVVAVAAFQAITTRVADQNVIPGAADHGVVAVATEDDVMAETAVEPVIAGAAENYVIALATVESV